MMVGLIVILVGIFFLLHNLGLLPSISWGVIWPVLLIIIGISMLEGRRWWWGGYRMRRYWRKDKEWGKGNSGTDDDDSKDE